MERKLNWTLDVSSHPPLLPQISIPHQKRQACSLYPIYQKKLFFAKLNNVSHLDLEERD